MKELSRNELKKIIGGSANAGCTADCKDGSQVSCDGAGCTATDGVGCKGVDSKGNVENRQCPQGPE